MKVARTSHVYDHGVSMISKKAKYVQQTSSYVFLGTFERFAAGTPVSQDASTPGFPDPEQMQRLLAPAEEFAVRILAVP
jgi:hypothetical protein